MHWPNVLMLHAFGTCANDTFNYVSWSISAEMGMYVLAPLLLVAGQRSGFALAIAALAFAATLEIMSANAVPWEKWTFNFGVLRALPSFAFGAALFYYREHLRAVQWPRAVLYVSTICFFVLPIVWPGAPVMLTWGLVCAVCVAAAACDLKNTPAFGSQNLSKLSPLTYSLYMWHPLVFTVIVSFGIGKVLNATGIVSDILLAGTVVLAVGVAFLSLVLIEKPLRRSITALLLERGERKPDPAPTSP